MKVSIQLFSKIIIKKKFAHRLATENLIVLMEHHQLKAFPLFSQKLVFFARCQNSVTIEMYDYFPQFSFVFFFFFRKKTQKTRKIVSKRQQTIEKYLS
jgi:hypothetical protein